MEQLETWIQKDVCDMEAIKDKLSFIYFLRLEFWNDCERKEEETVFDLLIKVSEGNLGHLHTTKFSQHRIRKRIIRQAVNLAQC